jgi:type VI secretion system protein ImpA
METLPLFDVVDHLLAPLPGDDPTGPSIRYDSVVSEIRVAREADNPSLPQGEWERPLKKADWPMVARLCTQCLAERSKDLQLAAWLTEAWIHLHGLDGLRAGIRLVSGLMQAHWDAVHPRQDAEGDFDARVASLAWMNETLPLTLRLHTGLLQWPDRKPAAISLEDWNKAPLVTPAAKASDAKESEPTAIPSREKMTAVVTSNPASVLARRDLLQICMVDWKQLDELVNAKLGNQAPSLSRVMDMLTLINRAIGSLLSNHQGASALLVPTVSNQDMNTDALGGVDNTSNAMELADPLQPVASMLAKGPIQSRTDAYRLLEIVADYLQRTEPHSPTPYLVRRAVGWGQMPLPDLMREVLREEGDLNRFFAMLGLKPTE